MTFNIIIKRFIASLGLMVASQSSFAIIVFDPTNWVQTNATAIATIKTEITQAQALINQFVQLKNEFRNLKEMGVVGIAARALDVENELRAMTELRDAGKNLFSSLQQNDDYVGGIQKMINVSALTADKWLEREQFLIKQKNASATYMMKTGEANMKAIEEAQKQRDKVLSDNDFSEGIRGTAMKTNVLIGNLISVQSAIAAQLKGDSDFKAVNATVEANEKAMKQNEGRKFIQDRINAMESAGKIK